LFISWRNISGGSTFYPLFNCRSSICGNAQNKLLNSRAPFYTCETDWGDYFDSLDSCHEISAILVYGPNSQSPNYTDSRARWSSTAALRHCRTAYANSIGCISISTSGGRSGCAKSGICVSPLHIASQATNITLEREREKRRKILQGKKVCEMRHTSYIFLIFRHLPTAIYLKAANFSPITFS